MIASLYLFLALAVVCDEYFVPAVEKICAGERAKFEDEMAMKYVTAHIFKLFFF